MKKAILVFLAVVFLLPNFIDADINPVLSYDGKEQYDPALNNLNSIQKLTAYIDQLAKEQQISEGSIEYAVLTETVIKKRFYHGYSHFTLKENWLAAVSEKIFGNGLASVVDPDEIVKYPSGACSQQSIVMIEALRRKNYDHRSVSFPHHYALEFGIGRKWYFFDPNMEPEMSINNRLQSSWSSDPQKLVAFYDKARYPELDWILGVQPVVYGKSNVEAAPNAKIFQASTGFLSKILWLIPVLMLLYPIRQTVKKRLAKILFYTPSDNNKELAMDIRSFN